MVDLAREPAVLYHYTQQTGLLGIIESKSIWATKSQYLNDSKEFRHAFDVAKSELATLGGTATTDLQRAFYAHTEAHLSQILDRTYFVASFSEHRDLLSQWRAYCRSGNAFSLGFTVAQLRRQAARVGWELVKCVYDYAEQRSLLREVVVRNEARLKPDDPVTLDLETSGPLRDASWWCVNDIARLALRLKHDSFAEESEWRLVSGLEDLSDLHHKFRPGRFSLIPYTEFPLWDEQSPPDRLSIVVGPAPDQVLTSNAVMWFVIKRWSDCEITFANNAYRDW